MKKIKFLNNKKAFDLPFSWIFALIVGAMILFLAIYGTSRFIQSSQYEQYTEAAKSITILLDPLETGIADAKGNVINFKKETRTEYNCFLPAIDDSFGKQTLSFSEKSSFGEWAKQGGEITIRNKFIFSDQVEQGNNLYLFSKPFYFGFKVGDIIVATSKDYCFVSSPNVVQESIGQLGLSNLNMSEDIRYCGEEDVSVCFGSANSVSGCDIRVYSDDGYETGYVKKQGQELVYSGNLLYGAIFSDGFIYECNVKRFGAKISELAEIYNGKIDLVSQRGCNSLIQTHLTILGSAKDKQTYQEIIGLYNIAQEMDRANKDASCRIYLGEDY